MRALCRKDKKAYVKSLSEKLEREANYGSTRSLFDAICKLKQKFAPKIGSIKDENEYTLTDETSIKERWKRYVEKLYESKHKSSDTYTDVRAKDDEETEPFPLLEEVEKALNKIKKNKSPEQDEITIELLTAAGNSATILHRLCVLIWKTGKWPEDWSKTIYVPLPKNGDMLSCENYRTIALASHASKILLIIISERMRQNTEEEIAKEQAGFYRRRGTRDQIFNLRLLSEKFRERKKQLFLCFIDYRKALDCVCHEKLWEILTLLNFPKHLIGLVESLYKQQLSSVRTIHGKTDWFHNGRGVHQGCILSPYLFNLYTEWIMREALE